jgi:hypothetical protein
MVKDVLVDYRAARLWYTKEDYKKFQTEMIHDAVSCLLHHETDPRGKLLMQIYFALRSSTGTNNNSNNNNNNNNAIRIENLYHQIASLDATLVGLHEHIGQPHMVLDYQLRRRHLLYEIHRLQQTKYCDRPQQQQQSIRRMIAETSRLTSHASRVYAGLVAQLSMAEWNDTLST